MYRILLTHEQHADLRQRTRQKGLDPRTRERLEMVRLSDVGWSCPQIAPLLGQAPAGRGRPRADDRRTLEAILYKQRTGYAWAALPPVFGDEETAHRRLQQWIASGLWDRICALLGPAEERQESGTGTGANGAE